MRKHSWLISVIVLGSLVPVAAKAAETRQPLAEIFGQKIYDTDLTAPAGLDAAGAVRARGEMLRARVWKAVFEDFARSHNIDPTEAEIVSNIENHRRLKTQGDAERASQHEALIAELKSSVLSEDRRKQAQQHLDNLNKLADFERRRAQELRDPARRKLQEQSERKVAEQWVRQWKLNQALYREFGGRIIFQQAGWEPIDAYRQLLQQYESKKAFIIADATLHAAVYGYFEHKFVYADETKARFYFEKPYWERTREEMRASGF